MKIILETERLLLREVAPEDAEGFFLMDSDPAVARFVGGKPVGSLEKCREIIAFVQEQYSQYGMGRWSVLLRETGEFIGWSGMKRMLGTNVNGNPDFVDIGYRYQQRHWGQGYATEAALACLQYAFEQMTLPEICALADVDNWASRRVLLKIGLPEGHEFDWEDKRCVLYSVKREEWLNSSPGSGAVRPMSKRNVL